MLLRVAYFKHALVHQFLLLLLRKILLRKHASSLLAKLGWLSLVELRLRLLHYIEATHALRLTSSHVGHSLRDLLLLLSVEIGCGRFHHSIIVLEHHLRIPHEWILRDPAARGPVRRLLR